MSNQNKDALIELTATWTTNGLKYGKSVFLTKQEIEKILQQKDSEHKIYEPIKKLLRHTVLDIERL
jgi:hypothetical protein